MNDRELLELAAKAAGITLEWQEEFCYIPDDDPEIDPLWRLINGWKPLEDDGDALRLAVKLGIQLSPYPIYTEEKHSVIASRLLGWACPSGPDVAVLYKGDPMAATRRAIVLAAAEIGKAMP